MNTIREPLKKLTDSGLPEALEVMGERWAFMILRASFNGLQHFEEFLSELGIARNILSNRLAKLVDHGILSREPCVEDKRRIKYQLKQKGVDLLPAMLSLREWGNKYGGETEDPVVVDKRDRLPILPIAILSHDQRILEIDDLMLARLADLGNRPNTAQIEDSDIAHKPRENVHASAAGSPIETAAAPN